MSYTKLSQTINNPVKTKHCPKCDQDLLVTNFSSTRAKYCLNCKKIVELEQKQEMTARALGRSQNKKQKKEQVISIADLKKSVQRAFNKFIRLRDKDLPCVSCQKWSDKFDAGHYINQGSTGALRYNEDNVHKQCSFKCNNNLSGNKIEYRISLVKKIGVEKVEWLEQHRTDTKHWQREELEELLTTYKEKIKELE
jgi:ribosomal protein L44E